MGVSTYETKISSIIPPARLFKSFVLDADNLFPKVAPQVFKSIEILEGDGGVGTIKKTNFGEWSPVKYLKQRVDAIDHANFTFAYSVIEGDVVSQTIEKVSHETKIVGGPDGGSILTNITHFHTKGDYKVNEEQIKAGEEKALGLFKDVEAYVVAHPEAYN